MEIASKEADWQSAERTTLRREDSFHQYDTHETSEIGFCEQN